MNIRLEDGQVVEVWISDQYADDATPRAVREAYQKRQQQEMQSSEKWLQLQKLAKELGLELPMPGQAPASPAPIANPTPAAPVAQALPKRNTFNSKPILESNDPNVRVVDGRTADTKMAQVNINNTAPSQLGVGGLSNQYAIRSICMACNGTGETRGGQPCPRCEGTGGDNAKDLKDGEVASIERVKGRNGLEIAIPTKRVGKMGTTTVRVVDNGGDRNLQDRFKSMAHASMGGQAPDFRNGYDARFVQCGMCHGKGITMGQTCPKCGGAGEFQHSNF
jgi:hypothetical protein